jgi:hypothetical protein
MGALDDPLDNVLALHLILGRHEIHGCEAPVDTRHAQMLRYSIFCGIGFRV